MYGVFKKTDKSGLGYGLAHGAFKAQKAGLRLNGARRLRDLAELDRKL